MSARQVAEFLRQSRPEIERASELAWDRIELLLEALAEFELAARPKVVVVVDDEAHGLELAAAREAGRAEGYAEGLRRVRALLDAKEASP